MKYFYLLFLILHGLSLRAQEDSIRIEQIVIKASSLERQYPGTFVINYNSQSDQKLLSHGLSDIIMRNGLSYVKTYGFGTLATLSSRGTSASQNQILWNGISIINPMVGLGDLSLVNGGLFNEFQIQKTESSGIYGSGAMGAVVNLSNNPRFNHSTEIINNLNVTSLKGYVYNGRINFSREKWYITSTVSYEGGLNEFVYKDNKTGYEKLIDHNSLSDLTLIQSYAFKPNNKNILTFDYWFKNKDKDIPVSLFETQSLKNQKDKFHRMMVSWQSLHEKMIINSRLSYFNERIKYTDEAIGIETPSNWDVFQLSSKFLFLLSKNFEIRSNINARRVEANISNYSQEQKDNEFSFTNTLNVKSRKTSFQISNRIDINRNENQYFLPSLIFVNKVHNNLDISVKLSKGFRNPGMNDLYWSPGGNIRLQAETSTSQEIWLQYFNDRNDRKIDFQLSFFHRYTSNWILWSPFENTTLWQAQNLNAVRSYGLESRSDIDFNIGETALNFQVGIAYNKTLNQKSIVLPRIEKGQQLNYTPVLQSHFRTAIALEFLDLAFTYGYTGMSLGVNENIDSNHLMNLEIAHSFSSKTNEVYVQLEIQNLLGNNYFIIERRPMPGRIIELTISSKIQLHHED